MGDLLLVFMFYDIYAT